VETKKLKELQAKVADYTRFAYILVALSAFLYIGVLIPGEGKTEIHIYGLMGVTIILLGLAFTFFRKVISLKKMINENIEQDF